MPICQFMLTSRTCLKGNSHLQFVDPNTKMQENAIENLLRNELWRNIVNIYNVATSRVSQLRLHEQKNIFILTEK